MRRAAEYAVAAGVAVGLHLAGFAALGSSAPAGVEAAGDGGDALVSLMAADAAVAALVEDWERPPELALSEVPSMPLPEPEAVPDLPAAEAAQAMPTVPDLPALPVAEDQPDLTALAPPPKPEVKPAPEPAPESAPKPAPEPAPKPAPEPKPDPVEPSKPATPAPEPSAVQPAQVAAGQGDKGAAGDRGAAAAATVAGAGAENLRAGWGAEIRARIERRKSYPRDGDGAEGTVKLRIVVGTDGRLRGVAVASSSGSTALDAAAVKAVQRAGRFPRAPKGLDQGEVSFTLPVSFKP